MAIDYYYIHKNGNTGKDYGSIQASKVTCGAWPSNGGYGINKLAPILIGSSLLSKESEWNELIESNLSTPSGRQCFGETGTIQPPNRNGKDVVLYGARSTNLYHVSKTNPAAADAEAKVDGSGNEISSCPGAYQACCITGPLMGSATAVMLIPEVLSHVPKSAKHWLDYVDRSRLTGIKVGSDFGAFCDSKSLKITGYEAAYDHPMQYQMYDKYRKCTIDSSCQLERNFVTDD